MTKGSRIAIAVIGIIGSASPTSAQIRDAVYRGTLICAKSPFIKDAERSAIEVAISGSSAKYTHPVLIAGTNVVGLESGIGTVDGNAIKLAGNWKGEKSSYESRYSGSFVRRSAKLTGNQVWTIDGRTYTRTCTGAIKRPLAAFLPRKKKS